MARAQKGLNYSNLSQSLLEYFSIRGDTAAKAELRLRRQPAVKPKSNPRKSKAAPAPQAPTPVPAAATPRLRDAEGRLITKSGSLYKRQRGDAKRTREAAWTDKKRAHVERTRRVMSYARDLMQELGWYPGEAIRVAWADEKAGKLQSYVAKTRSTAPEGLFESVRVKNNPFGYDF